MLDTTPGALAFSFRLLDLVGVFPVELFAPIGLSPQKCVLAITSQHGTTAAGQIYDHDGLALGAGSV